MHPNVHFNTIYNSQVMEATEMSIDRWMDKDVTHIYNGILLGHKKKWNWVICSELFVGEDLESVIQSEVSQKEK